MPYTLAIGWSPSPNFGRVCALAAQVPGTTTEGSGRDLRLRVPCASAPAEVLGELLPLVAGWRGTVLRSGDHALPELALHQLAAVVACAQE